MDPTDPAQAKQTQQIATTRTRHTNLHRPNRQTRTHGHTQTHTHTQRSVGRLRCIKRLRKEADGWMDGWVKPNLTDSTRLCCGWGKKSDLSVDRSAALLKSLTHTTHTHTQRNTHIYKCESCRQAGRRVDRPPFRRVSASFVSVDRQSHRGRTDEQTDRQTSFTLPFTTHTHSHTHIVTQSLHEKACGWDRLEKKRRQGTPNKQHERVD